MKEFLKKMNVCESVSGPELRPIELNQNKGTVTIDYRAYYHMHHDSLMLHLLVTCEDKNTRLQLLDELCKQANWLGQGYKAAQCPIVDVDAICYVYGLVQETVERMIYCDNVYMEDANA